MIELQKILSIHWEEIMNKEALTYWEQYWEKQEQLKPEVPISA